MPEMIFIPLKRKMVVIRAKVKGADSVYCGSVTTAEGLKKVFESVTSFGTDVFIIEDDSNYFLCLSTLILCDKMAFKAAMAGLSERAYRRLRAFSPICKCY